MIFDLIHNQIVSGCVIQSENKKTINSNRKKISRSWLPILLGGLIIIVLACGNEDFPDEAGEFNSAQLESVDLGDTLSLTSEEPIFVDSDKVRIELIEIIDDSRCPTEELILCIWEGQVTFKIKVTIRGTSTPLIRSISTADHATYDAVKGSYTLSYASILPEKKRLEPIDIEDYIVKLVVTAK